MNSRTDICKDKVRILVALKESAGDVFILSGVLDSLKKKYINSNIYVATSPQFQDILQNNPNISAIINYDESMKNYRQWLRWAFVDNPFNIVYYPAVSTQICPHNWLADKWACYLGQVYANACNIEYGEQFIDIQDVSKFNLSKKYITIQNKSGSEVKDFDYFQQVVDRIENIDIVQIGGESDPILNNVINLCGKSTYRESAGIIKGAELHVGPDSVNAHFAAYLNTPSTILFGGTFWQAGINPEYKSRIKIIETPERGLCYSSCHMSFCEMKKLGNHDKCINNISIEKILDKIASVISHEFIKPLDSIKLSAYLIIKDGVKYGFPFEKAIRAAAKICDEVIVVDGESKDDTWEHLESLAGNIDSNTKIVNGLKVFQHPWDLDDPALFGNEKNYARFKCIGTHCLQLDADEIITEPYKGAIKDLIKHNYQHEVLDLPVINFYGDTETIRVEMGWKWRISKNDPNILHGIHGAARKLDDETMKITMDKKVSDGCLPAGERIFTEKGLVPIEEIKVGDRVLGHSSEFKKVLATNKRKIKEKIYKIKPRGFRIPLRLTGNHKILIDRWGQNNWIPAEKIEKTDNLVFTIPNSIIKNKIYDLSDFIENNYWEITNTEIISKNSKLKCNRKIELNEDLAWLLGLYTAEGSLCNGQPRFSLHLKETDIENICIEKFKKIFGMTNRCEYIDKLRNGRGSILGNVILGKFFKYLCGNSASTKKVPIDILLHFNTKIINAFLEGYLSGDGSYYEEKNIHESPSASPTLSYEIFILYCKMGNLPNIYIQNKAHKKTMPNGKEYNIKESWKTTCVNFNKLETKGCKQHAIELVDNRALAQPLKIEIEEYNGYVYNIEVEEDHSYMTQAFHVKNCEYIYNDSFELVPHKLCLPMKYLQLNELVKQDRQHEKEYLKKIEEMIKEIPLIFHYSWLDLKRKEKNGEFWQETWHSKNSWTHNIKSDIVERIKNKDQETLIKIDFDHPLKKEKQYVQ